MMTLRHFTFVALMCGAFVREPADAWAQTVQVLDSVPAANTTINGRSTSFSVRFDRPVDHVRSVLVVKRDGEVIETATLAVGTAGAVCQSANLASRQVSVVLAGENYGRRRDKRGRDTVHSERIGALFDSSLFSAVYAGRIAASLRCSGAKGVQAA